MRLFFLAVGDRSRASSRLRVWDHVDWFRANGHDVYIDYVVPSSEQNLTLRLAIRTILKLPVWLYRFFWADAIYLQETLLLAVTINAKNWFKARKLIFDFSDPIDMIGSGWKNMLRRRAFRIITCSADHIIFENAAYFLDFKDRLNSVSQFYGPVDVSRYATFQQLARLPSGAPSNHRVVVGWTGSPATVNLISFLFPILDRIAQVRDITLILIGLTDSPYNFENLSVVVCPWDEAREFELVPTFDVGLFALDHSEKSKRRGAGKLFIYMAAGVPFIATDRGIASDLMNDSGIGFRVARDADWEACLLQAIDDSASRQSASHVGMRYAYEKLSYQRFRELLCRQLKLG